MIVSDGMSHGELKWVSLLYGAMFPAIFTLSDFEWKTKDEMVDWHSENTGPGRVHFDYSFYK